MNDSNVNWDILSYNSFQKWWAGRRPISRKRYLRVNRLLSFRETVLSLSSFPFHPMEFFQKPRPDSCIRVDAGSILYCFRKTASADYPNDSCFSCHCMPGQGWALIPDRFYHRSFRLLPPGTYTQGFYLSKRRFFFYDLDQIDMFFM